MVALRRVLWRKLLRDLWHNKGALAALLAIVTIGTGLFIGYRSVYSDLDRSRNAYYAQRRLADFSVSVRRAPAWAVDALAKSPNVRQVRGRVSLAVLMDLPGRPEPVSGQALSMPGHHGVPVVNDILMQSGTWFTSEDAHEAILDDSFAKANHLRPGDRLKVLLLDRQHELLVVGTAISPEYVYMLPPQGGFSPDPERFGVLYLPERFLRDAGNLSGASNEVVGLVADDSPGALRATMRLVESALEPYGVASSAARSEMPSVQVLGDKIEGLRVVSAILPTIFLGFAALVLQVLMGRIVAQQRAIIGTLKAVGRTSGEVLGHYLAFAFVVGVAGGVAGIAFGLWMERAILHVYEPFFTLPNMVPQFQPLLLAGAMALSVGFACLGAARAAWQAARLAPAEAMRPALPQRGGRVLLERFPALWRRVPFRSKMVLRSALRYPMRFALVALAAAVSTTLVYGALEMVDAIHYLMHYQFDEVSHEDYSVLLRDPVGRGLAREADRLPGVAAAEEQLIVACDLTHATHVKRTAVTGLEPGARLTTPLDASGLPLRVPESGIVLTRKLADLLHAGPGDAVALRPLIGRRDTIRAPVAAVFESYMGLSAYADLQYLARLLGEDWAANAILVRTQPGASDAVHAGNSERRSTAFQSELKRWPTVVGVAERQRTLTLFDNTYGKLMISLISIMVFFSGLIAFTSVFNAALVSLGERQREVGTLRTLGYTSVQVAGIFSGESLLSNALGIALGLVGGIGLAHLISRLYDQEIFRFPAVILPASLALAAAVMAGFVAAAQAIVLRLVRRLNWLEVLQVRE